MFLVLFCVDYIDLEFRLSARKLPGFCFYSIPSALISFLLNFFFADSIIIFFFSSSCIFFFFASSFNLFSLSKNFLRPLMTSSSKSSVSHRNGNPFIDCQFRLVFVEKNIGIYFVCFVQSNFQFRPMVCLHGANLLFFQDSIFQKFF